MEDCGLGCTKKNEMCVCFSDSETHKACVGTKCEDVDGAGSDECTTNAKCEDCDCGSWSDKGCGGGTCASDKMYQTRSCDPNNCKSESQCTSSSLCGGGDGGCSCKLCTHATPSTCESTPIPAAGCPCTDTCTSNSDCSDGGGTPVDPCDGVSCGSCQYCSGGNCYDYCSGTSSSCGCTSCVSCSSCRYCSGTTCRRYCSGTDTSCGCTSCTNCNAKDKCDGPYLDDYYCEETSCDYTHELNTECAGLAADVAAVSNFYNKGVPVVLLNISNPFALASGKLTLSVRNEGGVLMGSCSQTISLSNKIFFGTAVKDAHFYPWAESVLLTEEEIAECKEEGMSGTPTGMSTMSSSMENDYMSDNCDYYNCSQGTYPNYGEDNFYEKYPGLKILENTPDYLKGPNFVRREMPNCETLFKSLSVGFYDLTASLEVVT
ncbi:hypothetical protein FP803_04115 [Candidatus Woesearchaeota archaeon]|nr:hypothetical protein [Candidatus Woesearchaeota archaeon]